eukprot:7225072-Alexandrium_andersonii.AAC.1
MGGTHTALELPRAICSTRYARLSAPGVRCGRSPRRAEAAATARREHETAPLSHAVFPTLERR